MRSRGLIVSFIGMLAVLGILVAIAVIIVIGQLKKPAVGSTSTPAAVTCQQVLPLVLQNLSGTPGCGGLNASQACYANHQLTVSYGNLAANVTPPPFSDPGNIAPLESLKSIQASPLNLGLGQWGVALMKLRADLPGTVGGAPVTFIIYGDTKLEVASQTSTPAPGDADTAPLAPINAFYLSNGVTLQPSCTAVASETLPAGGLLIDSPDGRKVKFTANGAEIVIGSGVIMRAVPNQQMIVTVLHGGISVTAHGQTVSAGPLQEISVPLGGTNGLIASGPPSPAKTADIAPLALPNVCKLARAAGLNADCPTNLPTATASATSTSTVPATFTPTSTLVSTATNTATFTATSRPITNTPSNTPRPTGPLGGGNRIVYVVQEGEERNLYAVDIDSRGKPGAPIQLTSGNGNNYAPTWSPNGQQIAFIRDFNGQRGIWLMDSNGGNQHALPVDLQPIQSDVKPLTRSVGTQITFSGLAWSPVGNAFIFNVTNGSMTQIYITPADKFTPRLLSSGSYDRNPAWSPDGSQIVYVAPIPNSDSGDKASHTLYLIQADGSNANSPQQLYDDPNIDAYFPMWRPHTKTIAFAANVGGGAEVDFVSSSGGKPRLFINSDYAPTSGDWSPDSNYMVFASGIQASRLLIVSFPQTDYQALVDGGTYPRWSPTVVNTGATNSVQTTNGSCDGLLPTRVKAGMQGVVTPGDPNLMNLLPETVKLHPENKSVGRIPAGGIFDILKGPSCADGVVWWLVNYQGTIGWTGESMGTTYWFDPYGDSAPVPVTDPTAPAPAGYFPSGKCDDTYLPTQVKPKMQGIVNPDGKGNDMYTLPQLPSFNPNSKVVGYIPPSGIFDLLNGPWCDQGIVWWQVNYKGAANWTIEASGKEYWFQPYEYVPG